MDNKKRDQWGSKLGFVLAAAGSAVGLGNIWRFPYITGKYGGAAFVFIYIAVVALIGMSVMIAELSLGRNSRLDVVGTFKKLAGFPWTIIGWSGLLACTLLLSYYAVIAGWTFVYMFKSVSGLMETAAAGTTEQVFIEFISDPVQSIFGLVAVMGLVVLIVCRGISSGIERACKFLMPALFLILLVLIVRSVTLDGASKGLEFYLKPDFSKVTMEAVFAALGQGFYSLSLGVGMILTYGTYLDKKEYLPSAASHVVVLDTMVAFLSGLVIFPAVFAFGMDPGAGAGLAFITLPCVFAKMPFGGFFSGAFFMLLFLASLTSAISILEVVVTYAVDQLNWSRKKGTVLFSILITILGVPSALSQGAMELNVFGMSFLDAVDFFTNRIAMPVGGLLIAVFVGWFWHEKAKIEITNNGTREFALYNVWLWSCRIIAPMAILLIFFDGFF